MAHYTVNGIDLTANLSDIDQVLVLLTPSGMNPAQEGGGKTATDGLTYPRLSAQPVEAEQGWELRGAMPNLGRS